MKLHFRKYLGITAGALALVSIVCVPASAQNDDVYARKVPSKPLPDGGPAPRTADGHPDLTGHWYVGLLGKEDALLVGSGATEADPALRPFDPKVTPEEKPSFQPWAAEKMKQQRIDAGGNASIKGFDALPKAQKIAQLNDQILHLSKVCWPRGVPGILLGGGGHGIEIVQGAGILVQVTEANHDYRLIPTDGRPHTKSPDPGFNGEGVGHWEGDTLVIDTIAIDERAEVSAQWTIHSDQEHVIERITRPSLNYLNYQITIEDPKVLTKPWNSVIHHLSLSHEPVLEWYCGVGTHDDEDIAAMKVEVKQLEEEK
jgi:hypothetical protein